MTNCTKLLIAPIIGLLLIVCVESGNVKTKTFKATVVKTTPFAGQKPGTSGLRKKVPVFQQQNYTENFVQCVLDGGLGNDKRGSVLVVGGDGRFLGEQAISLIIKIAAANGVSKLIIGRDGILSTPAISHLIRKGDDNGRKINGGIILTASHNPGGPKNDFGIKFNCENGGPAPDNVTDRIYQLSTQIAEYQICADLDVDISQIGTTTVNIEGIGHFTVQVVDSVKDYADYMEQIFDFKKIKDLLNGKLNGRPFHVLADAMNGVTGPYVKSILVDRLGAPVESCLRIVPKPDFGGGHPDPNLTYAKELVDKMAHGEHDIGAAFDGDGDRNMIIGRHAFFVTPSDSLAVIAANLDCIPYFADKPCIGYARSMPTACAVDRVAQVLGRECYEVPTGWKYFGNLMDAGKLALCGEESFGTGSDHIREKDGIWAFMAWLQILAHKKGQSVEQVVTDHWRKFGRNVFLRYDYEDVESAEAAQVMNHVKALMSSPNFVGTKLMADDGHQFVVTKSDNYEYTDLIDGSVAKNQGLRIFFADGSRVIYRLSGTGSAGATIRLYLESFVDASDAQHLLSPAKELLRPLVSVALDISKMEQFTGRTEPTVIT